MRRRTFLASTGALLMSPVVGRPARATGGRDSAGRVQDGEFGPLGRVEIGGAKDAVVDTETVYVAATDGFATVDVSDPVTPAILAERRGLLADAGGPLENIWDLDVDGDRLAVGGPANDAPTAVRGMVIYDVSDPTDPRQVDVFQTNYPIHNLTVVDGRAYLTGNDGDRNPLVMVDVSAKTASELGRWSLLDHDEAWTDVAATLRVLHDVWVRDDRAYLAHWDAGTWIVDVSDPADPSTVARVRGRSPSELASISGSRAEVQEYIQTPGNDHYVATDENASLLAVGAEAWDVSGDDRVGGPGDIELYDISTPTDPQQLSTIEAPSTPDPGRRGVWTTSHNFDLVDGHLYTSWYRGGVRVHDVSDPANPQELAAWADRDRAQFFTAKRASGRPFFVASSTAVVGPQSVENALYTFSTVDDAGTPEIMPPTTTTANGTTTATQTDTTTTTTTETTTTTTTAATTTTSDTAVPTPDTEPSTASGTETTASGSGAGFGPLATLGGLLAGAGYAFRRRHRE